MYTFACCTRKTNTSRHSGEPTKKSWTQNHHTEAKPFTFIRKSPGFVTSLFLQLNPTREQDVARGVSLQPFDLHTTFHGEIQNFLQVLENHIVLLKLAATDFQKKYDAWPPLPEDPNRPGPAYNESLLYKDLILYCDQYIKELCYVVNFTIQAYKNTGKSGYIHVVPTLQKPALQRGIETQLKTIVGELQEMQDHPHTMWSVFA
jgi:hypothetical protein